MSELEKDIDILIVEFLENKLSEKELHYFFEWICADKKNERYFFDLKAIHDSRSNLSVKGKKYNRMISVLRYVCAPTHTFLKNISLKIFF